MKRTWIFLVMTSLAITGMIACSSNKSVDASTNGLWYDGYPLYEVYVRAITPEGTFNALREKLPELKAKGLNNLWLMPIHPIGVDGRKGDAGCPYAVRDYFNVNPEYGTMADFDALVQEAHKLGMKVILDMVMNHSSNDHVEMENHKDWYALDEKGDFTREVADWSDVTDWNYDNQETRQYLMKVLRFWVQEHDVDGYRCDVAGMVPGNFWKPIWAELKEVKPSIFLLAEHQGADIIQSGFDADYDWNLYHRMHEYNDGTTKLDVVWHTAAEHDSVYPPNAKIMRFIENHDEQRVTARFGDPNYKAYAAFIFTIPGIPLIYNGQEIGADHRPSLFDPEPVDWTNVNEEAKTTYDQLLKMRNESEILRKGTFGRMAAEPSDSILCYVRALNSDSLLVAVNFSENPVTARMRAKNWSKGKWSVLYGSDQVGQDIVIKDGVLAVEPWGYRVLKRK